MTKTYYDATGVLILDQVTPVIKTLFKGFRLTEPFQREIERIHIAQISATNRSQWRDVRCELASFAKKIELPLPETDNLSIQVLLKTFAIHFESDQDEKLTQLIDHQKFEGLVDIDSLFLIASCFNDGHNLAAIQYEDYWYCNTSTLFNFGRDGYFISQQIRLFDTSSNVRALGEKLRNAILTNAIDEATNLIIQETFNLLAGVTDTSLRAKLQKNIARGLLTHLL